MAHFDRFDICEAYYCFASDWHGGMGSEEYQIFGRLAKIKFQPRPNLSYDTLEENAREIYEELERRIIYSGAEIVDDT